jgi:hypothetical protein
MKFSKCLIIFQNLRFYNKKRDHFSLRCSGDIKTLFVKQFILNLLAAGKYSSIVVLVQFVALPYSVTLLFPL